MPRAKFKLTEKRKRALAKAQRIAYGKRVTEKFKKTLERKRAINKHLSGRGLLTLREPSLTRKRSFNG
jgi:hypothetical protein